MERESSSVWLATAGATAFQSRSLHRATVEYSYATSRSSASAHSRIADFGGSAYSGLHLIFLADFRCATTVNMLMTLDVGSARQLRRVKVTKDLTTSDVDDGVTPQFI